MHKEPTFEDLRQKANPTNSIKIGYSASKEGIVLKADGGEILIPKSMLEEMLAKVCVLQRKHGDNVIFRGKDR